jgi:hypothetical protein
MGKTNRGFSVIGDRSSVISYHQQSLISNQVSLLTKRTQPLQANHQRSLLRNHPQR